MAKKRMTTTQITDSDEFVQMASSSQALWWHLNSNADDDGFNNQVQMAMYKAHASIDDLKVLLTKRFIYQFESGVIVIKHWRMANAIRKDRYTPTVYQEELKMLGLKDNGAYTWLPNGCQMVAIDKNSIDKNRLDKNICTTNKFVKPTLEEVKEYCKERNNNVDPEKFIDFYTSKGWKVGNQPMKDWKACVRIWERKDSKQQDSLPNYDDSCNNYLSPEELEKSLARRNRDTLPIYDPSKNKNLSNEEIEELLANRGK